MHERDPTTEPFTVRWRLSVGCASDKGRVRERNEDAYKVHLSDGEAEQHPLADAFFAIADGAGGHDEGELASLFAVESVEWAMQRAGDSDAGAPTDLPAWMASLFQRLNRDLRDMASGRELVRGMKSTLTVAVLLRESLYLAHVGDTRCYLWREGVLRQLTEDHSWPATQRRAGLLTAEEEKVHPHRNLLTQCLGIEGTLDVWLREEPVRSGDRLLLCSDGLHGVLDDAALADVLDREPDATVGAHRLIEMGIEHGSRDNLTAVIVQLEAAPRASAPALRAREDEVGESPSGDEPVGPVADGHLRVPAASPVGGDPVILVAAADVDRIIPAAGLDLTPCLGPDPDSVSPSHRMSPGVVIGGLLVLAAVTGLGMWLYLFM